MECDSQVRKAGSLPAKAEQDGKEGVPKQHQQEFTAASLSRRMSALALAALRHLALCREQNNQAPNILVHALKQSRRDLA